MDTEVDSQRTELLVLRAQAGDRAALDRLLQKLQTPLFGYLLKLLGNHADAEDALQATLLQIARKIRWLRDPGSLRAWAFRIASRLAFRTLKFRKRNPKTVNAETMDAMIEVADTQPPNSELLAMIPQWLDRITARGREAVMLHYIEGFTTEQVAEILDIPVGTAKSRISYALSCIRTCAKYEGNQT